jgi:hypothetical protein
MIGHPESKKNRFLGAPDCRLPRACIEITADTFRLNPQVRSINDE